MQFELSDESSFPSCTLHAGQGISIGALGNGCVQAISRDEYLINQIVGSPLAGGLQRIYLRILMGERILFRQIVGPRAQSDFAAATDRFVWSGEWQGLRYSCTWWLGQGGDRWIIRVELTNESGKHVRCDVLSVQDLGIATRGQVRNNELFTSQYLDHTAVQHSQVGWLVMTRQNLSQSTEHVKNTHPWIVQGCLPAARGFVTDGLDFFGVAYKDGIAPEAISREVIGERVRQGESAICVLQSSEALLPAHDSHAWDFFASYLPDHPKRSTAADCEDLSAVFDMRSQMNEALANAKPPKAVALERSVFQTCEIFRADDLYADDIDRLFSDDRRHEEIANGELQSFFYGEQARHVVLKAKELASVRPHGHLLRTGEGLLPDSHIMSCAFYASGAFASQLAMGNSSVNKFLSVMRDHLSIVRSSGLRIFIRYEPTEEWKLLSLPSAFEMALQECSWYYKDGETLLTVTCRASNDEPAMTFSVSVDGRTVEVLISGEIVAGPNEYESRPRMDVDAVAKRLTVRPDPKSMVGEKVPHLAYHVVTADAEKVSAIGGDELLLLGGESRRYPYFAIQTTATQSFEWTIFGTQEDAEIQRLQEKFERRAPARDEHGTVRSRFWGDVTANVHLAFAPSAQAAQFQDVLHWFARDAVIHLSTPRGLEQANGGAWGVRDVCQGPVEFLLSYGHSTAVADILRMVFSRQFAVRGDWPQWFGFAPFHEHQSANAHGDVLIWPLKALCEYLQHTDDGAFLREPLPYTDDETIEPTSQRATVLEHVDRLIARMREQPVEGHSLPRYGEGDWDDSLQPADPHLAERMISSWTSELMFQTLRDYADVLKHFGETDRASDVDAFAQSIRADFRRHLMPDGIVAGFAVLDAKTARPADFLLHPSDRRTGLKYRLIPMTRGIISGIFSPEEAKKHLELIREHLLFPDGARLMDRPTEYRGGEEVTFRRAESAAYFGREIGLQYVHAHLRYAQALAVVGRADELFEALLVVNPIAVTELVPGGKLRQRNAYFSSSDADFRDRYQASREYDQLKRGEIATGGGWRIYSSGPGIYTNLVVRHLFGLRRHFEFFEFDPVLPRSLDGAAIEIDEAGRRVRYQFSVQNSASSPLRIRANGVELSTEMRAPNPYRAGGVRIPRSQFNSLLMSGDNLVEIEL